MHLPTIRELVRLNQSAGLVLKEPNEVPVGEIRSGAVRPISAINPNGETDDQFYYSNDNYARPSGDLGRNWFWSSSVLTDGSDAGLYLYGHSGNVFAGVYYAPHDDGKIAVRCVVGQ